MTGATPLWEPPLHRNFGRLVLVCIDSYDSESRRFFLNFSRSTRFTILCTAPNSKKFSKMVSNKSSCFPKLANLPIFNLNALFSHRFDEKYSGFHHIFRNLQMKGFKLTSDLMCHPLYNGRSRFLLRRPLEINVNQIEINLQIFLTLTRNPLHM